MYGKRFRIRRHRYRKQYIASSWTLCSCVRNEDTAACVRTYPTCMCHGLRVTVAKCLLYLDILARRTETMNCVNKRNHHCSHCSIERYKNKDLLQREPCCCFARSFGDVLSMFRRGGWRGDVMQLGHARLQLWTGRMGPPQTLPFFIMNRISK